MHQLTSQSGLATLTRTRENGNRVAGKGGLDRVESASPSDHCAVILPRKSRMQSSIFLVHPEPCLGHGRRSTHSSRCRSSAPPGRANDLARYEIFTSRVLEATFQPAPSGRAGPRAPLVEARSRQCSVHDERADSHAVRERPTTALSATGAGSEDRARATSIARRRTSPSTAQDRESVARGARSRCARGTASRR